MVASRRAACFPDAAAAAASADLPRGCAGTAAHAGLSSMWSLQRGLRSAQYPQYPLVCQRVLRLTAQYPL